MGDGHAAERLRQAIIDEQAAQLALVDAHSAAYEALKEINGE